MHFVFRMIIPPDVVFIIIKIFMENGGCFSQKRSRYFREGGLTSGLGTTSIPALALEKRQVLSHLSERNVSTVQGSMPGQMKVAQNYIGGGGGVLAYETCFYQLVYLADTSLVLISIIFVLYLLLSALPNRGV